jgi:hypothetical protein
VSSPFLSGLPLSHVPPLPFGGIGVGVGHVSTTGSMGVSGRHVSTTGSMGVSGRVDSNSSTLLPIGVPSYGSGGMSSTKTFTGGRGSDSMSSSLLPNAELKLGFGGSRVLNYPPPLGVGSIGGLSFPGPGATIQPPLAASSQQQLHKSQQEELMHSSGHVNSTSVWGKQSVMSPQQHQDGMEGAGDGKPSQRKQATSDMHWKKQLVGSVPPHLHVGAVSTPGASGGKKSSAVKAESLSTEVHSPLMTSSSSVLAAESPGFTRSRSSSIVANASAGMEFSYSAAARRAPTSNSMGKTGNTAASSSTGRDHPNTRSSRVANLAPAPSVASGERPDYAVSAASSLSAANSRKANITKKKSQEPGVTGSTAAGDGGGWSKVPLRSHKNNKNGQHMKDVTPLEQRVPGAPPASAASVSDTTVVGVGSKRSRFSSSASGCSSSVPVATTDAHTQAPHRQQREPAWTSVGDKGKHAEWQHVQKRNARSADNKSAISSGDESVTLAERAHTQQVDDVSRGEK